MRNSTTLPMDTRVMGDLIRTAKAGDRLKLVFTESTFDGDLPGRIYPLLGMHDEGTFKIQGEMDVMNLLSVAQSGKWHGFTTYTIKIEEGFDGAYFINRTIGRSLLVRVEKVPAAQ